MASPERSRPPEPPLQPVGVGERVVTLDVLRGAAILGILLVNIEVFRGADVYRLLAGDAPDYAGADAAVQFTVGWLATGKFVSSFALLFGLGAAIMLERATAAGHTAVGLLVRRYAWLAVFGSAHMLLLFSGDILFVYAVTGFVLLPFTLARARTVAVWAAGLLVVSLLAAVGFAALEAAVPEPAAGDPLAVDTEAFFAEQGEAARTAYVEGGLTDQIRVRAVEAAVIQGGQLLSVPWLLSLFLFGLAAGRAGWHRQLARRRVWLRRIATVAVPLGLAANLPQGFAGTLPAAMLSTDADGVTLELLGLAGARIVGAPLLAVGYLSLLALACQRPGFVRAAEPLRLTGRMALSAYVLQSVLATGLFVWLGAYDRWSPAPAMVVVAGMWVAVLAVCSLWLQCFPSGPLERLWRRLTYRT